MQVTPPRTLFSVMLTKGKSNFLVYVDETQLIGLINNDVPVYDEKGRLLKKVLLEAGKFQGRPAFLSDVKNQLLS